jgi:hypothetical protein
MRHVNKGPFDDATIRAPRMQTCLLDGEGLSFSVYYGSCDSTGRKGKLRKEELVLASRCRVLPSHSLYSSERAVPISDFTDSTPIATREQFKAALLTARQTMTDTQLEMLRAHCRAPNNTISAASMAEALSIISVGVANSQYGKFAQRIADALHYTPSQRPDGKIHWWCALAYAIEGSKESRNGNCEWVMRPELVAALQSMKWA